MHIINSSMEQKNLLEIMESDRRGIIHDISIYLVLVIELYRLFQVIDRNLFGLSSKSS